MLLAELQDSAVTESSGVVASRRNPGLFWTHNDSGDGPHLYCFDDGGRSCGVWRVTGADARDWEDMAAGPGPDPGQPYLYAGDIGDNRAGRPEIVVYRVREPAVEPSGPVPTAQSPSSTAPAAAIHLLYPDGAHDAEALLVHPTTGDLYVVTKELLGQAGVYRAAAPLDTAGAVPLERVAGLEVPGPVTGGDIAPDGRRVVLCTYADAYEMVLPDPPGADFDRIWSQPMATVALGARQQGEAVAYRLDGRSLVTTSEGAPAPVHQVLRRSASG